MKCGQMGIDKTREMPFKKETIFSIITVCLTIVTILIGIIEYRRGQEYNIKMEFLRTDEQKQMDVYSNICNALGKLAAAAEDLKEYNERFKEFTSIYWGDIILVEDTTIEKILITIR